MPFHKPILLIIFNRPEMVRQIAGRLAAISPIKVYIASDGPRSHIPGELEKVRSSRDTAIKLLIDNCYIDTLFQNNNLGCKKAVQTAIDWFFKNEPEGIILEDDCLPDESFFPYCAYLLDHYRDDSRIGIISGDNFQFGGLKLESSYYFSRYAHVWGWASWRRVWKFYRSDSQFWEEMKAEKLLHNVFNSWKTRSYWENILRRVYNNRIDTWDYQLNLSLWSQNMLSIIPACNMVTNIGFDNDATHTKNDNIFSRVESTSMQFPLIHPKYAIRNSKADRLFDSSSGLKNRILNKLRAILPISAGHDLQSHNLK